MAADTEVRGRGRAPCEVPGWPGQHQQQAGGFSSGKTPLLLLHQLPIGSSYLAGGFSSGKTAPVRTTSVLPRFGALGLLAPSGNHHCRSSSVAAYPAAGGGEEKSPLELEEEDDDTREEEG